MRKLLIVAEMRSLEKQVHLGEISYSRMIEIINEKADTLLSDKLLLAYCEIDELTKEVEHKNHTIENDAIHIETLTKEVERLRNLNKRLFTLWENLYEAGEISISKNFSTSFNEIRESINNLKK